MLFLCSRCTTINITQHMTQSQSNTASQEASRERPAEEKQKTQVSDPKPSEINEDFIRLGILGGVTSLSFSKSSGYGSSTQAKNLHLGLTADFRTKYFGLDFEGYYGKGPFRIDSSIRRDISYPYLSCSLSCYPGNHCYCPWQDDGGKDPEYLVSGSAFQYGVLVNGKVKFPIDIGRVRLSPKVGFGYGAIGGQNHARFSSGNEEKTKLYLHAPFVTVGLELNLHDSVIFLGEVSGSLEANGEQSEERIGLGENKFKLRESNYSRLGLGVQLKLSEHFILGVQFTKRKFTAQKRSYPFSQTRGSQHDTLGLLMVQF